MSFQKGVLYLRMRDGEVESLFYPVEEVPEDYRMFSVQQIAVVDLNGKIGPYFSNAVEMAKDGEYSGTGILIQFRKVTEEDLSEIRKKWSSKWLTWNEWLAEIATSCQDLLEEEQSRLVAESIRC